jgi:1-acyl-sn-glycerol-3-phosphate acyltransferase
MKWISIIYLKIIRWKTGSILDPSVKKCVLVGAPHTSNMDFPVALATYTQLVFMFGFLLRKVCSDFPWVS